MPLRVFLVFLAILLAWSGIGTRERVLFAQTPAGMVDVFDVGGADDHRGTVEDHDIDDQPQVQPESTRDLPVLLGLSLPVRLRSSPSAWPHGRPAPMRSSPCIEGLLRPPCVPVA
jgi:hypothetical protein